MHLKTLRRKALGRTPSEKIQMHQSTFRDRFHEGEAGRHGTSTKTTLYIKCKGRSFFTSIPTHLTDPSSFLAEMIKPNSPFEPIKKEGSPVYVIDRNPRYFDFILDYLRSPEAFLKVLPTDKGILRQIHVESTFFGLRSLTRAVEKFSSSLSLWED
ncbi:BTB/POZ domain-containing protein KCTD2-like [Saccostrea cucullata]|uniref:BTB/POZ domain-containing protein KCTD2-like n=1 Tax=Saccostrea cuccullata TaxID=36930 RepID=UPI002ED40B91